MNIKKSDVQMALLLSAIGAMFLFLPWSYPDESQFRHVDGRVTTAKRVTRRRGTAYFLCRIEKDGNEDSFVLHYLVERHCPQPQVGDSIEADVGAIMFGPENKAVTLRLNDETLLTYEEFKQHHRHEAYFWFGLFVFGGLALLAFVPMIRKHT